MKHKSFVHQGLHTIGYKIISLVVVFVSGILTARWLGPEGKGILSVYFAVTAMIVPLAELGIRQSVAYMSGQKLFPEIEIYAAMKWLFLFTSVVCLVILMGIFIGLGFFHKYGFLISLMFLGMVPLSLYESYNNGILIARKNIEKINYLAFFDKINTFIFIFITVVFLKGGVLGAALGYLMSRVINFCLVNFWLKEYFFVKPSMVFPIIKEMLKKGFVFALALFIIQLNYKLDVLVLQKLTDDYSVGIYSVGVSFAELLKEVPLALGMVLFSRSSNWGKQHRQESLEKTVLLSRVVFALMIVLSLCLAVGSKYFVPLLYGSQFNDSIDVTWALLPGIVMLSIFLILNLFMAGQGKPYVAIFSFLPALILNILLNIFYIPKFGYIAAAVNSTISYSVASLLFVVLFVRMYKLNLSDVFILTKDDFHKVRSQFLKIGA